MIENIFSDFIYKSSNFNFVGMSVEHDIENFIEGKDIILTIKDRGILEEEGLDEKDVLVNVNLVDNERAKTYIKNVKDARIGCPQSKLIFSKLPSKVQKFSGQTNLSL